MCTLEEFLSKVAIISEPDGKEFIEFKNVLVAYPDQLPEFAPKPSEISMRQVSVGWLNSFITL